MVTWRHLLRDNVSFLCSSGSSRYVFLGLPMDWTTTYVPGTRFAPGKIREASCNIELYSLLTRRSLEHLRILDLGDADLPFGDVDTSLKYIERVVEGLLEEYSDGIYFFIGGEHLVTYPVVKTLIRSRDIDRIIVFDAHGDLRDEYMGLRYSHATVMRRIVEETGIELVIIGVRALSREEAVYAEKSGRIKLIHSNEPYRPDVSSENIYVSIDMDSIDPGYAPGVSNPEALGLTPFQLLDYLRELLEKNKLVGLDLVEVNPLRDVNDVTSILASKILVEVLGVLEYKR